MTSALPSYQAAYSKRASPASGMGEDLHQSTWVAAAQPVAERQASKLRGASAATSRSAPGYF